MFNQKQIEKLLQNENVHKCSSKSITFTGKFKIEAVRKYYEDGCSPSMIFRQIGLSLDIIDKDKARGCLCRWRCIYSRKGNRGLTEEYRGINGKKGRPRIKYENDKEKVKYLETEIAYLKEENRLLKKTKKLEKP